MNREMLYTVVYRVITTFFYNLVIYKTYNEDFTSKEEIEDCFNNLREYSLNYGLMWLWKKKQIFNVELQVIVNDKCYLITMTNIMHIKIFNQLTTLTKEYQESTDTLTQKCLLKKKNRLSREMEEAKNITLEYFRKYHLDSNL